MKADDFRSIDLQDLDARIQEMRKQLFNLRMQLHSSQLSNTNRIREMRRDISRALTVKRELISQAGNQS
ncbi:MAG: 50S ribosomal protein L29 [Candidatus Omnitrophota bacterium]|nr:MAG: 50S ribosomal protein L29 [Candidatus Omnitrophota bacterium]